MRLHPRDLPSSAAAALLLLAGLTGCGAGGGGDDNWYYHFDCHGDSECLGLNPLPIGTASGTLNEGPIKTNCTQLMEFSSRFWNMPPATDSCDHSPLAPVPPPPVPTISTFTPATGVEGTTITVSGSGFLAIGVPGGGPPPAGFVALVGTVPAVVVSVASNQVVLTVPPLPPGAYPITIQTAGGRSVSGGSYTVRDPILVVATSGHGSVVSTPAGIDCRSGAGTCSAAFPHGTVVQLTETPAANAAFDAWLGGGCSGAAPGCGVTLTADTSVTASFLSHTLAVLVSGNGRVVSSPAGIDCTGARSGCTADFAPGTAVTLAATPGANASFGGWSGDCEPAGTSCTRTLGASASVQAHFLTYVLTVLPAAVNGTSAGGTITSAPAGITCAATGGQGCTALFAGGTEVTLTAAPADGSSFAGWDGGGCSGAGACTFTLAANATVTAQYCVPHGSTTYSTPGTFAHVACAGTLAVQAWGAGGGGGAESDMFGRGAGSGGGGGGFGAGTLDVPLGSAHAVTVGAGGLAGWAYEHGNGDPAGLRCTGSTRSSGGAGGASRFGALLEATGGGGGSYGPNAVGAGGTSTAAVAVNGAPGQLGGVTQGSSGGAGGAGGNGGAGGIGGVGAIYDGPLPDPSTDPNAAPGSPPGGGGGGGAWRNFFCYEGAAGAGGKVVVTW